jgi:hypothetical protein
MLTTTGLYNGGVAAVVPIGPSVFISLEPTQSPIQSKPGVLSPEVKRLGREADHSPPSIVDAKKTSVHASIPPYIFMAKCLVS